MKTPSIGICANCGDTVPGAKSNIQWTVYCRKDECLEAARQRALDGLREKGRKP